MIKFLGPRHLLSKLKLFLKGTPFSINFIEQTQTNPSSPISCPSTTVASPLTPSTDVLRGFKYKRPVISEKEIETIMVKSIRFNCIQLYSSILLLVG